MKKFKIKAKKIPPELFNRAVMLGCAEVINRQPTRLTAEEAKRRIDALISMKKGKPE